MDETILEFGHSDWAAFISDVKCGRFDIDRA
jgi:hypothetical protein